MANRAGVTTEGIDELQKVFAKMGKEAELQLNEIIEDAAIDALGRMTKEVPVDTGNLRRNTEMDVKKDVIELSSRAYNEQGQDYAPYVENGTRLTRPQPYFWHNIRIAKNEIINRGQALLNKISKK